MWAKIITSRRDPSGDYLVQLRYENGTAQMVWWSWLGRRSRPQRGKWVFVSASVMNS